MLLDHELRFAKNMDPLVGLPSLADKSVDHTITDPPYDEKTHKGRRAARRNDGGPALENIVFEALGDLWPVAQQIARVTRRWALIFCAESQIPEWKAAFAALDFDHVRTMPWVKPDGAPQMTGDRPGQGWEPILVFHGPRESGRMRWNGGGGKGVYIVNVNGEPGRFHQTQKPIALLDALVRDFTDYGELIADPYSGSATTLVSAKKLGRRAIGWEQGWAALTDKERKELSGEQQVQLLEKRKRENFERSAQRLASMRQQIELAPARPMKQAGLFSSL